AGGELTFWTQRVPVVAGPSSREAVDLLAADYLALLRKIGPTSRRVTDKMPQNFLRLGGIHLSFPRARIIHCRRDAVDTCLSIYFHHFGTLKNFTYERDAIVFVYQQYRRLMRHWRRILPPDRFFEINYEDLIADRERLTRKLIAFTGLDW